MYNTEDIANFFLCSVDRDKGDSITHLKLQKLLYYAQAWALVSLDKPLFDENFQAWAHGPVVRSVYDKYKSYSWHALPFPEECGEVTLDSVTEELLNEVMEVYGSMSASDLEHLTHSELPWQNARGELSPEARCENIIEKDFIKSFYKELSEKSGE